VIDVKLNANEQNGKQRLKNVMN